MPIPIFPGSAGHAGPPQKAGFRVSRLVFSYSSAQTRWTALGMMLARAGDVHRDPQVSAVMMRAEPLTASLPMLRHRHHRHHP